MYTGCTSGSISVCMKLNLSPNHTLQLTTLRTSVRGSLQMLLVTCSVVTISARSCMVGFLMQADAVDPFLSLCNFSWRVHSLAPGHLQELEYEAMGCL